MKIAICDEDRISQKTLEEMINEYSKLRRIDISIDKFNDGYDLLNSMNDKEYDIVFLDYKIGDTDGIEVTRILKEQNSSCWVIFVSVYESIINSHKINYFRFIKKPINKEILFNSINDYMYFIERDGLFVINTHEGTWKIKISDIIYAEAKGKDTLIRTTKKTYEVHTHLKEIGTMLPPEKFCRCQKAYIVGLFHIENYTNTEILFDNGERAQIGRKYLSEFKDSFQDYVIWYNSRYI